MSSRRYESGAVKRKKKEKQAEFIASQKGSMLNFVQRTVEDAPNLAQEIAGPSRSRSPRSRSPSCSHSRSRSPSLSRPVIPLDPGLWPESITDQQLIAIVEKGPRRETGINYPKNDNNRHFSDEHYVRKLNNGEIIDRKWLVYSKQKDAVFCFCCKLFSDSKIKLTSASGQNDWQHLPMSLRDHESSEKHMSAMKSWLELEMRIRNAATIDETTQRIMRQEAAHWHNMLERIIAVVQFLADRSLAFRGNTDRLYVPNNGNFLGLIELLAKFDPVTQEHIRRIRSKEVHDHYLGKDIQNELINLVGGTILKKILDDVRRAKYFSIILDCTPDASHREQMTLVIRIVDISGETVEIRENFVGFLPVESSTGLNLTEVCLKQLEGFDLQFEDCRGQGYDNGSNMRGCHSGVQKRLLNLNPKAFYVPCACHSLNLVLGDMAKASTACVTLFGVVQQIFILFSASTQRWQILKEHVKDLTVKPLCETRWECRIESLKAIRYQLAAVYDALVDVAENANDAKARTEAAGLAKQLKNYPFLVTLLVWYDLIAQINIVSKLLQSEKMQFDIALSAIEGAINFLKEYKETGLVSAEIKAKELAEELEMSSDEIKFPEPMSLRRKRFRRQFAYEAHDEPIEDHRTKFRIEFFNTLLDQALMSMNERFQLMKEHADLFGFLYALSKIGSFSEEKLQKHCNDLMGILGADIDSVDLFNELKMITRILPHEELASSLQTLRYIYKNELQVVVPNLAVALRIILTAPVTVAAGERSFSKLKLIKNYLRTTMTQERLNHLAIISIEKEVAKNIGLADVIKDFAAAKARKIDFLTR